jgi:hypothetical protein
MSDRTKHNIVVVLIMMTFVIMARGFGISWWFIGAGVTYFTFVVGQERRRRYRKSLATKNFLMSYHGKELT